MVREEITLSFEEYFWQDINLDGKIVLDAGTGFGLTTCEIARRISIRQHCKPVALYGSPIWKSYNIAANVASNKLNIIAKAN